MSFFRKKKTILFSLVIVFLLGIFQALQTYFYKEYDPKYIFEDFLGEIIGKLILWMILPIIIAIISKVAFKKQFWGALLVCMVVVSIPFALLGSYGHYYEYANNKQASMPTVHLETDKFDNARKIIEALDMPELMTNKLNSLISGDDEKTRSANPETPSYVFDALNQKIKSVLQSLIWEKNGLMDQYAKIYADNMTDRQLQKLLEFYEHPLFAKANSDEPLSDDEQDQFIDLYNITFSDDITSHAEKIEEEIKIATNTWAKYAVPKSKAEINDYLKSFGYTLDGYILSPI